MPPPLPKHFRSLGSLIRSIRSRRYEAIWKVFPPWYVLASQASARWIEKLVEWLAISVVILIFGTFIELPPEILGPIAGGICVIVLVLIPQIILIGLLIVPCLIGYLFSMYRHDDPFMDERRRHLAIQEALDRRLALREGLGEWRARVARLDPFDDKPGYRSDARTTGLRATLERELVTLETLSDQDLDDPAIRHELDTRYRRLVASLEPPR